MIFSVWGLGCGPTFWGITIQLIKGRKGIPAVDTLILKKKRGGNQKAHSRHCFIVILKQSQNHVTNPPALKEGNKHRLGHHSDLWNCCFRYFAQPLLWALESNLVSSFFQQRNQAHSSGWVVFSSFGGPVAPFHLKVSVCLNTKCGYLCLCNSKHCVNVLYILLSFSPIDRSHTIKPFWDRPHLLWAVGQGIVLPAIYFE